MHVVGTPGVGGGLAWVSILILLLFTVYLCDLNLKSFELL